MTARRATDELHAIFTVVEHTVALELTWADLGLCLVQVAHDFQLVKGNVHVVWSKVEEHIRSVCSPW